MGVVLVHSGDQSFLFRLHPRSPGGSAEDRWPRSGRRIAAAVGATVLLLCSACAAPGTADTAVATATPIAAVHTQAAGAGVPGDLLAPSSSRPVSRGGQVVAPTIMAASGDLSAAAPARYPDGISVVLQKFRHGVESGSGPGRYPGRKYTALTLKLTNHSAKPVDLNQVVVTTTYGSPARIAAPVYDDATARDFSGKVRPGHSSSATYVFAIPADELSTVAVSVDFDSAHVAAELVGNLR